MRKYIYLTIILLSVNLALASNVSTSDKSYENKQISKVNNFTEPQTSYVLLSILPIELKKTHAPWGLPSFWFAFVLSAVGTYTLYGIVAAPIAVTIVYLSSKGNRQDTKRAIIGSLLGIAVGGALKYFMMNI